MVGSATGMPEQNSAVRYDDVEAGLIDLLPEYWGKKYTLEWDSLVSSVIQYKDDKKKNEREISRWNLDLDQVA